MTAMGRCIGMTDVAVLAVAASLFVPTSKVSFVKKTVKSHDIVIFSKSYCPWMMDGAEIQDASSDFVGRRTVPQVFINGNHLGGSGDTVEAYESGKIQSLLGIHSEDDDL